MTPISFVKTAPLGYVLLAVETHFGVIILVTKLQQPWLYVIII